ncbi:6-pyruvoyl-tetrahydropterin synthase-related protein [Limosilactobacillus avium]|uniref:6-pyruvoyl-tetrahydropterin synthase-related protein n=1 Tax=Limosilactobacillus avium TaxID=2991831 RepID=UPI0024B93FE4|nr:6-pyruvoyl-tetrahydropterin synthase-related protein [Limosilactobacillus avium]
MFHANRMEELYRNIQQGSFIPRISTATFNQVGSGINFFYPWLLLYPWVLLRLVTNNPISAFYLYIILETFVTFSISYYGMHKYSGSKRRALIFSLLYTFANYRLFLVFHQNVLAESIAYTFLPLVLLGFYEVFFRDKKKWPLLAIGMSLLLYSHMLTTALTAFFLLITLLIFWRNVVEKGARMLSAIKAVGLSILLTAFYLFPFIEQTLGNHLRASWTGFNFIQQPMQVIESSINNEPDHTVGFLLILTVLLGFTYLRNAPVLEKYSYFAGLILVVLTTSLFPWGGFLNTPLANLQFPFRLNGLATVMLCIYLSFIINNMIIKLKVKYQVTTIVSLLAVIAITFGLMLTTSHQIINQRLSANVPMLNKRPTPENYYPAKNGAYYNLTSENWHNMFYYYGHNGAFDYFPVAVKGKINDAVVNHQAIVDGKKVYFANRLTSKPNQLEYNLTGIKAGANVKLPVLYYKNDFVKIGNEHFEKPTVTKVDTIQVRVPKHDKQIIIKYRNSVLDNSTLVVSLVSWLGVLIIYIGNITRKKKIHETVFKTN